MRRHDLASERVPKIVEETAYNGVQERIARLGLVPLLAEIRSIAQGFPLLVKEAKDANGGAAVRRLLDLQFEAAGGWAKRQTGGVDWTKCRIVNDTTVCVGVEVQFSARSDLIVIDIIHLREAITSGRIDVGVILVPSNRLGLFLTDRGPKMADAKRHVQAARADDLPLLVIALEHDGPGPALAKQAKRSPGDLPPGPPA
jgi:hypothetical protein